MIRSSQNFPQVLEVAFLQQISDLDLLFLISQFVEKGDTPKHLRFPLYFHGSINQTSQGLKRRKSTVSRWMDLGTMTLADETLIFLNRKW